LLLCFHITLIPTETCRLLNLPVFNGLAASDKSFSISLSVAVFIAGIISLAAVVVFVPQSNQPYSLLA